MKKSKAVKQNRRSRNILLAALGLSVLGGLYWATRGENPTGAPNNRDLSQPVNTDPPPPNTGDRTGVPPYYESATAAKPFPKLLPAASFSDNPLAARAYRAAADIPGVVAQQPCYCYCDEYGHKSLLDCYTSGHGAG